MMVDCVLRDADKKMKQDFFFVFKMTEELTHEKSCVNVIGDRSDI